MHFFSDFQCFLSDNVNCVIHPKGERLGLLAGVLKGDFALFCGFFKPGILTGKEMRLKMANYPTKIWVNFKSQQEILVVFGPYFRGPL